MGLFGKKKGSDTIDFTRMSDARIPQVNKSYKFEGDSVDLRNERVVSSQSSSGDVVDPFAGTSQSSGGPESSSGGGGMFGFLDSSSTGSASSSSTPQSNFSSGMINDVSEVSVLKTNMRKMSSQIEGHSNEVYRLTQRLELLEKKLERFEHRGV